MYSIYLLTCISLYLVRQQGKALTLMSKKLGLKQIRLGDFLASGKLLITFRKRPKWKKSLSAQFRSWNGGIRMIHQIHLRAKIMLLTWTYIFFQYINTSFWAYICIYVLYKTVLSLCRQMLALNPGLFSIFALRGNTVHYQDTISKIRNKYSQKRNCVATVTISIHLPMSYFYIPTIDLPILPQEICGPTLGIYISPTDTFDWEMGFSLQCRSSTSSAIVYISSVFYTLSSTEL